MDEQFRLFLEGAEKKHPVLLVPNLDFVKAGRGFLNCVEKAVTRYQLEKMYWGTIFRHTPCGKLLWGMPFFNEDYAAERFALYAQQYLFEHWITLPSDEERRKLLAPLKCKMLLRQFE
jgi:hypothetical protein